MLLFLSPFPANLSSCFTPHLCLPCSLPPIFPSHFLPHSIPHLVTMPILSYTYIEMVQSTQDKLQESLGDTLTQHRLVHQDEFRRLPYLTLATPTVLYGLSSTLLHRGISSSADRILPSFHSSSSSRTTSDLHKHLSSAVRALWLDYFSMLLTDVTLYPLQTVLVRLYCQGMPALVDNVQTGTDTVFISSYYGGLVDCVTGIMDTEGPLGFFKGFSSLLVKYWVHGLVLLVVGRTVHLLDRKWKS